MERRINDTLRELEITRIAIAHRPETIRAAERVFVSERKVAILPRSAQSSRPRREEEAESCRCPDGAETSSGQAHRV